MPPVACRSNHCVALAPVRFDNSAPAGIFNFGVQAMLFTFLLYALLAAETDPLSYTIKVLVSAHCQLHMRA